MSGWVVLLIATPLLIFASLGGGMLPSIIKLTHLRMQLALSFVSGLMLGVAVLHLMPHAVIILDNSVDKAAFMILLGMVGVFLLMRFLHVHSIEPGIEPHTSCEQDHEHNHEDEQKHHVHPGPAKGGAVRWITLLAGLSLHSIVDGAALAAAISFEKGHAIPGLLVFIVVVLHKPLDALAISATIGNDESVRKRVNLLYALIAPLAAWLAYLGLMGVGESDSVVTGYAMAFCAGAFICVALADLMPEVQFHAHHRIQLTAALAIGVVVALALGLVEGHGHGLGHSDHGADGYEGHDHSSHDHAH